MSWHSAAIHLLRRLRTEDRAAGIGPAQLFHTKTVLYGVRTIRVPLHITTPSSALSTDVLFGTLARC